MSVDPQERLSLRSVRDTAKLLSISPRTLWSITAPRGSLPAVRIGRRVLYELSDLERYTEAQKGGASHDEQ